MKIMMKIQSMYQCSQEKVFDLLLIGNKKALFLSNISITSCMIIHYIEEENIFVVTI